MSSFQNFLGLHLWALSQFAARRSLAPGWLSCMKIYSFKAVTFIYSIKNKKCFFSFQNELQKQVTAKLKYNLVEAAKNWNIGFLPVYFWATFGQCPVSKNIVKLKKRNTPKKFLRPNIKCFDIVTPHKTNFLSRPWWNSNCAYLHKVWLTKTYIENVLFFWIYSKTMTKTFIHMQFQFQFGNI